MNISCKLLPINFIRKSDVRYLSLRIEQLQRRALIKLSGGDVFPYLQGLITNDVNHLTKTGDAMFTHILNNKGRVLYDALLLKSSEHELLLECDVSVRDNLINHVKMYRVRKKVDVECFLGNVWAIFNDVRPPCSSETKIENVDCALHSTLEQIQSLFRSKNIAAFQDPRVHSLGIRIFADEMEKPTDILTENGIVVAESNNYVILRYALGVPEGATELPVGKCFPLEANCDYLHGVSFHKGCYIGQEVTARTHHTGIVRKRIMPLILSSVPDQELEYNSIIVSEDDKVVGRLRGHYRNHAIALLRLSEILENGFNLNVNSVPAFTYKPFWWPQKSNEDSAKGSLS